jgi:anti-sigma B factor antagonist
MILLTYFGLALILVLPRSGHGSVVPVTPRRRQAQEVTHMPEHRPAVELICGVPVVAAPGEIDITNAPGFRTALLEASALGHGTFVVDMSETQFCDSAGMHALVWAHKQSRSEGGEMLLVVRASAVLRVFAITGVDRLIPGFPSLEEALAQVPAAQSAGASHSLTGPESDPPRPS